MYVLLEDFLERREEASFERLDHLWVDLARDLDGQTQRLEQVVVEVRLARILKWKKHQYDSVHFDELASKYKLTYLADLHENLCELRNNVTNDGNNEFLHKRQTAHQTYTTIDVTLHEPL